MSKDNKRQRIEEELESIIESAAAETELNRTSKELTIAQAASIRYRSIQLIREGRNYHGIKPKEKARQINECWKQKAARK